MIPPSTPSGPQQGPREQHALQPHGRAPQQFSPGVQDGPDPSPAMGLAGPKPVQKRVVKPAAPERRPNPARPSRSSSEPEPLPPAAASNQASSTRLPGTVEHPIERHAGTIRRTAVSAAAAGLGACSVSAAVLEAQDGSFLTTPPAVLGESGSLLAPAALIWWLWLPIVALWAAYAVYQWLPRQRSNPRHDSVGWFLLAAEAAALGWLLAVSSSSATALVLVGAVSMGLGLFGVHRSTVDPALTSAERLLTDVPLGLFFAAGIFSFATSLAFMLAESNTDLAGWGGDAWALIGLVTVVLGVTAVCMTDRGHLPVALATVWGLSCVSFERLTGTPDSILLGAAAAGSAFLVLVSAGSRRHQVDHERRRNERRSQQELPSQGTAPVNSDA